MIGLAVGLSLLAWLAPSPARSAQVQPGWGQALKASLPKAIAAVPAPVAAKLRQLGFVDAELLPGPYAPVIRGLQAQGLTAETLLSPGMDEARRDGLVQEALKAHVEQANQRASEILAANAREEILDPKNIERDARDAESLLRDSALFLDFSVEDRLERVAPVLRRQAEAARSMSIQETMERDARRLSRSPASPAPTEGSAGPTAPQAERRLKPSSARPEARLSRQELARLSELLLEISPLYLARVQDEWDRDDLEAAWRAENWFGILEVAHLGSQAKGAPSWKSISKMMGRLGIYKELEWLGERIPPRHPLLRRADEVWRLLRRSGIQEPNVDGLLLQHVQGFPPPESLEPPEWKTGPEPFSEVLRRMAGMKPYVLGHVRDSRLPYAETLKRLGSWGRAWDLLRLASSPGGPSLVLLAKRLKAINLLALIQEYERSYSEPGRYRLPAAEIAQRRRDAKALARLLSSSQSAR